MPGISLKLATLLPGFFLALSSGVLFADQKSPEDYLKNRPLMLEFRYCECPASGMSSGPSEVLPSFMDESSVLKVGVSSEEAGFIASDEVSIGFELKPVDGEPGRFHFGYSGSYAAGSSTSSGKAKLMLDKGQWVSLFGAHGGRQGEPRSLGVAVRLVETGGASGNR